MTEKYDVFIKNGDVVIGQSIEKLNIGIKDQKITLLTTNTNYEAEEVIDAKNLTIMPGVIDSQVHFREPGSEYKEDMNTGTQGAALGGVTSIFEMPNTYPPTATVEFLFLKTVKLLYMNQEQLLSIYWQDMRQIN